MLKEAEEAEVADVDALLLLLTRSCCESGWAIVGRSLTGREEADNTADVSESVRLKLADGDVGAAALLLRLDWATAKVAGFSSTAA